MKKNTLIILFIILLLNVFLVSCSSKAKQLKEGSWALNTYEKLNNLINDYGINSKLYNKDCKPYAVFDFDNTTIINDVEEALLIYQIENLAFKLTPDNIEEVLITDIPDVNCNLSEGYENSLGEKISVNMLVKDITDAYTYLYNNYICNNGTKTLDEIHETNEYLAFRSKLRFLYDAIGSTFDASVAYPWVTYLFTGMTSEEVRELTIKSDNYWLEYPEFKKITWVTPIDYQGTSGIVSVSYKTALRITDEVKDLYNTLMTNGIEVYVCSASFYDVIVATATSSDYGLNVKEENIYAMRLKKDNNNRFINEFDDNYYQTQGKGKSNTIDKFIKPIHNDNDPILVAGDSAGDYYMMTDYKEMVLGLLFNRYRSDSTNEIAKLAIAALNEENPRYVLQGRNENTGKLIPSEGSILLGETEEKLVR